MNQWAQAENYRHPSRLTTTVTPEEYSLLYRKIKRKWRFKPKSAAPLITWAIALFILGRLVVFPLGEGIINYISKTNELNALKTEYKDLSNQKLSMIKHRKEMLTPEYILEQGRQIGLVQANEGQTVAAGGATNAVISKPLAQQKKKVEIGD
jgi:hypothetical protein